MRPQSSRGAERLDSRSSNDGDGPPNYGTQADYDRANTLQARFTKHKVYRDRVIPHWLDSNHFCYRLRTQQQQPETWMVDVGSPCKSLYRKVTDLLPHQNSLLLIRSPHAGLLCSGGGDLETEIFFVNRLAVSIRLVWLDWEGNQKEYLVVPPGGSHRQHTYASHAWMATTQNQCQSICAFVATVMPGQAIISGVVPVQQRLQDSGAISPEINGLQPIRSLDMIAGLRSVHGGIETEILFLNHMVVSVRLVWVDAEGKQTEYTIVPPGGSHRQHTYASHAWIVTTHEGQNTCAFVATERPSQALISAVPQKNNNASAEKSLPLILSLDPAGIKTKILFLNHMEVSVRLIWVNTKGKQKEYATISPGGSHLQDTYANHAWMLTTQDGELIGAFVATETSGQAVISGQLISALKQTEYRASSQSPDGKWIAFIQGWNVYLRQLLHQRIEKALPLTIDGTKEKSYEVGKVYWSPDSKKLVVFQKTTYTHGRDIWFVESSPTDQLHPKLHTLPYAKPGDQISQRSPRLFHVTTRFRQIHISPEDEKLFPNSWSIGKVRWESDSSRFTFLYNQRGHQVMRVIAIDAETGGAQVIVEEGSPTFIDYANKHFMYCLDRSRELIWMSERDGWNHLYLYNIAAKAGGVVKNQITRGRWVVRGVDRVDEEKRQLWFHASGVYPQQDPYYIHYCRINLDGSGLVHLTHGDGTHDPPQFSPDQCYLIDTYSRVDLPPVVELRWVENGALVMELERGDASALLAIGWKAPQRFVAKARDHKTNIYGVIFCPMNVNPNGKYPIIEHIYAGPHDSHVPKKFSAYHDAQGLAELGFIVVQIDGMGTSNRSKSFHDVCWKNVGDAGLPDRILWMKAAASKYPYMDLERVGIYGVSAGGQSSLRALLMYPHFYKVGVSACGCHDNRMDKIWWNELWMGWPVGPHYHEQSNVTQAHRLQGKLLLLVSEMDTNVDPASTLQVVNALVKADKDFDLLLIPGANHGMGGSYGERRMRDFFVRHLLGVEPRHH